jgi:hypothetical protein
MIASTDCLQLYLFGAPVLEQRGRPVHLSRRKATGMLSCMAFGKREYHEKKESVISYDIALANHGVGLDVEALKWLEQAYKDKNGPLIQIAHRFVWREMHWDPRFQEILRKMRIPLQLEYIRRSLDRRS